jgi:N-acetylmuramoyl-L-alanine amidase
MQLKNHRLIGAPFRAARLTGGVIVPEVVILHDTAGHLGNGSSVEWLATGKGASAHFVVAIDGFITQLVPTNRRAGHAGESAYHGRSGVNDFSIGIEIENPGRLVPVGSGVGQAWFGKTFHGVVEITTPEHGAGAWMPYPEAQIDAVEKLLRCLFDSIRTLKDIRGHWYVSPGRKADTNPLFRMEAIRARILGRDDPSDGEADALSAPIAELVPKLPPGVGVGEHAYVRIAAPGSSLNMRRWPSFNPNVIATIPNGAEVPVLRGGTFDGRDWLKVIFDGREGWIVGRYTQSVT